MKLFKQQYILFLDATFIYQFTSFQFLGQNVVYRIGRFAI